MATAFLATVFLVGFAWKMVVSATTFALLSYAIARIWWSAETSCLAASAGASGSPCSATTSFPSPSSKRSPWAEPICLAAAVGGGVVLALGGLSVLMARTDRRSLQAMAFVFTILIIGLVCFTPFGVNLHRETTAAQADDIKTRLAITLYGAALRGDLILLGDLISRGADVNTPAFGELTPLYGAAIERKLDAAIMLLDFGADVNSANGPAQRSPLHQAVLNGDVQMIKLLLRRGANVAATTTNGRTPLDYAIAPPAPPTKPENGEEIATILRGATNTDGK